MKNKFLTLMNYLKRRGLKKLNITVDLSYKTIDYMSFYPDIENIPSFVEKTIEEIIDMYVDKLWDAGPGSAYEETSDYYSADVDIDSINQTITFTEVGYTLYGSEADGRSYFFNDFEEEDSGYDMFVEVQKFLKKENLDEIQVHYNGGGDSGWIEKSYTSSSGSGDISEEIESICYELLEDFGGWEINEGSSGIITMSNDEINIEHEWNVEMNADEDPNIILTPDTFV
jgi:hypothetical protein